MQQSLADLAMFAIGGFEAWTAATSRRAQGRGGRKTIQYGLQRFQSLILELAVRGKLVPQDDSEEAAADFLHRVVVERAHRSQERVNRRSDVYTSLPDGLRQLPNGWQWSNLASLCDTAPTNQADDDLEVSFVPMTEISTEIDGRHGSGVRRWGEIKKGFTHFADGDIGVGKITPCFENGKAAIFSDLKNGIGAGTTELFVARPWSHEVNRRYLLLTMKTDSYLRAGEQGMTGTAGQKRITRKFFSNTPIPIPPLLEQERIVRKVDELFALCGSLVQELSQATEAQETLFEMLLGRLLASAESEELVSHWLRIEGSIDCLCNTADSVSLLQSAIIQLGISGRLVPQVATDEPAEVLLCKIREARSELLLSNYPSASEARNQEKKQAGAILPFDLPKLPEGWAWSTLMGASLLVVDCKNKTAPYSTSGIRLVRTTNVRHGKLNEVNQKYVDQTTYEAWSLRAKPQPGDLLITREAPMGEACIIPEGVKLCLGQRMMLARFVPNTISLKYILYTFMSPDLMSRVRDKPIGITVEHLRVGGVETLLIPIPPREEQLRIVEKLDELMALCDGLAAAISETAVTQKLLADAVVARVAA